MSKLLKNAPDDLKVNWSEDDVQMYIVQQLRRSNYLFHIGMEGVNLSPQASAKIKALGREPGWPDLTLFLQNNRVEFIELKLLNGKLLPDQEKKHKQLRLLGYNVSVLWCAAPYDGWYQVKRIVEGG